MPQDKTEQLYQAALELYSKARFEPVNDDPYKEAWIIDDQTFRTLAHIVISFRSE